jgi:fibronectin type 3 domain-containing protein
MIRETLDADSANVFMALKPVVGGVPYGNVFSSRTVKSGTTINSGSNSMDVPSWLKLVRSGSIFTGYISTDGATWSLFASGTVPMGTNVYAGLAVTSSGSSQKATAQFDNITISGTSTNVLTSIVVAPARDQMEMGSADQFSAVAYDQYRNPLSPQPAFTWSVAGGGTIDSNGLFTSGSTPGGPYAVTATSGTVSGNAVVTVSNIPNPPLNLTGTTATLSPGWVRLMWTDNSNIETGYAIQMWNGDGQFIPKTSVGANVTSCTITGLPMPSTYTYRVIATGSTADSEPSAPITLNIPVAASMPDTLVATPGGGSVALTWTAVPGASNYTIQRSSTSGTSGFSTIKANQSGTSYTDNTVTNGTTYYYIICYNVSGQGSSLYSHAVSATPDAALTLASIDVTPTNPAILNGSTQQFTAIAKNPNGDALNPQPTFTWTASGGGTIDSSGLFTSGTIAGGPYTVVARSGTVSGTATVTVLAGPMTSIAVTPASATVQKGTSQQYTAIAKDSSGNPVSPQPAFSWSVTGGGTIDANGLFTSGSTGGGPYTVTAASGAVNGTANFTVVAIPAAPSNVTATWATMLNGWYKLTWTDNSTNETGFTIQSLSGTTWSTVATVAANATSFTKTGLNMPSGPYNLRVIATGSGGWNSVPSNQVTFSIPTPPTMPDTLVATGGTSQIVLTWTAVAGANNYNIYRSATSGTTGFSAIKNNQSGTTYTDTAVVPGTTYYYKMCYNVTNVGFSLNCAPVSATLSSGAVLTTIAVSPMNASIQTGSTQQYTAVGKDQYGNAMSPQPAFTWSVSGGGAINSSGLFTSGTVAGGPYTVTATSGTIGGSATVTIAAGPLASVAVTPASASVQVGSTQQFSAVGSDAYGNVLTPQPAWAWSVSGGGTIDAAGLFTSGTVAGGPYTITAMSGTISASATITIAAGSLASIAVSPASADVQAGSTVQFSAVGADAYGNVLAPQPTWTWNTSGGGTIDSAGLFTSGSVAGGPYGVTASSGSVSGTANVLVVAGPIAAINIAPADASIQAGATQQYSAVAVDSYGNALNPQPSFAWSASGGGTIDSSGLFTADTVSGGPYTVTAISGSVSGATSVSVVGGVPAAPTNLVATWATMLNGWYKLTWTDNSNNETGFTIQILSGTTWSTTATVSAGVVTYQRTGLNMPSGPYTLRVIATGTAGNSAPSNQVTFSIPTPPSMPDTLVATAGTASVGLTWTAVSGASNYTIARSSTSATSGFSVIKYNWSGTSYTDSNAVSGTTYWYKVCYNVNNSGVSLYCTPVSATPN